VALAGGVVLLATSIGAQRSWSAILLPLAALGLFGLLLLTRWRVWALVAICLVPAYFGLRATEVIPTAPLPLRHADGSEFLAGRARSINLRMSNEQAVFDAVRDKPLLGTGAAHRDASGNWIMADHWGVVSGGFATLLRSGYIGLGFLMLGVMAPAMLTLVRVPVTHWRRGAMPLMIGGAVALIAFAINLVPNHIESPTFALLAGALVTVSRRAGEQARAGGVPFALHADSDVERWAKICGVGAEAVTGPLANGPGPATSRTRT
jgi:hypothetical protein